MVSIPETLSPVVGVCRFSRESVCELYPEKVCLTARGGSRPGLSRWAAAGGRCPLMLMPTPQSKGGILSKACDYIRELRQTNQRMQETFKEAERLQMDNELLRQQIEELKNENAVLRAQLQQHNLEMVGESARQ
ncbi:hypothetical protein J1605_004235 [Eschrichtius robustus]|uniref:Upstream stimulatory factor 2 n=1 Tax=Eschrichtius robustus TaxID=9764 RepID=A0AB34HKV0_ESCRO|nr:hypothetical protein J1605_004235 [Eschrichtius robustus]